MNGTPRALLPITEEVLVWVAGQRQRLDRWARVWEEARGVDVDTAEAERALDPRWDTIRKIELCALAARDVALFHELYPLRTGHIDHIGGDPHAEAPDLQDER